MENVKKTAVPIMDEMGPSEEMGTLMQKEKEGEQNE